MREKLNNTTKMCPCKRYHSFIHISVSSRQPERHCSFKKISKQSITITRVTSQWKATEQKSIWKRNVKTYYFLIYLKYFTCTTITNQTPSNDILQINHLMDEYLKTSANKEEEINFPDQKNNFDLWSLIQHGKQK